MDNLDKTIPLSPAKVGAVIAALQKGGFSRLAMVGTLPAFF